VSLRNGTIGIAISGATFGPATFRFRLGKGAAFTARVSSGLLTERPSFEIRNGLTVITTCHVEVHLTGQRSKWLASSYYGPNEPIKLATAAQAAKRLLEQ
jgi:hypothetical protein